MRLARFSGIPGEAEFGEDDVEFPNAADGSVFKHIAIPLWIKYAKIAGGDSNVVDSKTDTKGVKNG
jgi:hypothetical protein